MSTSMCMMLYATLERWRCGERLGKTWSSSTSLSINPEICREFLAFKGCGGLVGLHSSLALLVVVERQLDLTSVTTRLRGSSCVVLSRLDTGVMNQ
ncbi:hypothetical protein Taro_040466 [Colocasia esculenta]|uniref:Uncharacterized protein n=1 Tax=Colocasia esculenta TaxID=4460 RepID=A0A843WUM8_COLES|nr:hypothetical protein [Colocasia esculenta]